MPNPILVTWGQAFAASRAGIALGITVECRPLNFEPLSSPFAWLMFNFTALVSSESGISVETASKSLDWMNRSIFVTVGERYPTEAVLHVYRLN